LKCATPGNQMTLEELGLNAGRLFAGFCGGILHAFMFTKMEPVAVLASIVGGTLTANFLGPAAAHFTPSWVGDSGTAFIVGLGGMAICQGVVATVQAKISGKPPL
jgi:ABC-type xylose transport system permease subunit